MHHSAYSFVVQPAPPGLGGLSILKLQSRARPGGRLVSARWSRRSRDGCPLRTTSVAIGPVDGTCRLVESALSVCPVSIGSGKSPPARSMLHPGSGPWQGRAHAVDDGGRCHHPHVREPEKYGWLLTHQP